MERIYHVHYFIQIPTSSISGYQGIESFFHFTIRRYHLQTRQHPADDSREVKLKFDMKIILSNDGGIFHLKKRAQRLEYTY